MTHSDYRISYLLLEAIEDLSEIKISLTGSSARAQNVTFCYFFKLVTI